MIVRKTVVNSFSWAVMGFALTNAAYGQVAVPQTGDGGIVRDGQINADTDIEAPGRVGDASVDAAASAATDVQNTVDSAVSDAQKNDVQAGGRATLDTDGQKVDSSLNSNVNAGVNGLRDSATAQVRSNGTNNVNPFGTTFDSNTTDRLIIRDLQANSVASRLGLQAGDRIIGINGQTYTDVNQFDRDLAQWNGNTDMPIIYERNGMRYTKNFRMPLQNVQQSHNGPIYGNQGSNNQSYNSEQLSHSVNRPDYGTSINNGYSGGMTPNQGCCGGTATYGNNFHPGQAVCCGAVHAQQFGSGHHHGGRRHRRCGR